MVDLPKKAIVPTAEWLGSSAADQELTRGE
jgi:hypothetical protein